MTPQISLQWGRGLMLSQYQDARAAEITQDKAEVHTPMQLYLFMVADIYIYIFLQS